MRIRGCHIISLYLVVLSCMPSMHAHACDTEAHGVFCFWHDEEAAHETDPSGHASEESPCTPFCFCNSHSGFFLPDYQEVEAVIVYTGPARISFACTSDRIIWQEVYGAVWRPPSIW